MGTWDGEKSRVACKVSPRTLPPRSSSSSVAVLIEPRQSSTTHPQRPYASSVSHENTSGPRGPVSHSSTLSAGNPSSRALSLYQVRIPPPSRLCRGRARPCVLIPRGPHRYGEETPFRRDPLFEGNHSALPRAHAPHARYVPTPS